MADSHWTAEALQVLESAQKRSASYLAGLEHRAVAAPPEAVAALKRLDGPLPAQGCAPEQTLALLDELVSPATMAMAGPRFFGFVIGGALPVALAANWLAGAWDQNAALLRSDARSRAPREMALRWLIELFELPRRVGRGIRHRGDGGQLHGAGGRAPCRAGPRRLERRGGRPVRCAADHRDRGRGGASDACSSRSGMLGLGRKRVVRVPVDGQGRMRADALPADLTDRRSCACRPATSTPAPSTRSRRLIAAAHASGAWVHVDGAFGLWAKAAPSPARIWSTASNAPIPGPPMRTSGSTCPTTAAWHSRATRSALRRRWPSPPSICRRQRRARNPCDFTPELSRRARGVEVWAALRSARARGAGRAGRAQLSPGAPVCRAASLPPATRCSTRSC